MIRARQAGMQSGGCSIAVEQKQEGAQHPLPLLGDGLADGCGEKSLWLGWKKSDAVRHRGASPAINPNSETNLSTAHPKFHRNYDEEAKEEIQS